jgi:hypothetical protein
MIIIKYETCQIKEKAMGEAFTGHACKIVIERTEWKRPLSSEGYYQN